MTVAPLFNQALNFYQQYPLLVVGLAVILLFLIYRNPKESFKFMLFLLVMAAVIYAIGMFGETVNLGADSKQQMIHKTEQATQ